MEKWDTAQSTAKATTTDSLPASTVEILQPGQPDDAIEDYDVGPKVGMALDLNI